MSLNFFGLYFAFYYIGTFGKDIIGVSQKDSVNLILIVNGIGLFGRIFPNYASDKHIGPFNTLIILSAVSGSLLLTWIAVHDQGGLTAFAVVYGFFAAGVQSLFPAALSSLTDDLQEAGVRMGMVFSIVSLFCLTGPPIAGALIQANHGDYLYAQLFAGISMLAGSVTLVLSRVLKTGVLLKIKV
ncbi:MAG: hypothetical protein Q9166_001729 [cf. Caloplaca sp. 2 TL-2023]